MAVYKIVMLKQVMFFDTLGDVFEGYEYDPLQDGLYHFCYWYCDEKPILLVVFLFLDRLYITLLVLSLKFSLPKGKSSMCNLQSSEIPIDHNQA